MDNEELDKVITDVLAKAEGALNLLREPGSNVIIVYEKIQGMRDKMQYILRKVRQESKELATSNESD